MQRRGPGFQFWKYIGLCDDPGDDERPKMARKADMSGGMLLPQLRGEQISAFNFLRDFALGKEKHSSDNVPQYGGRSVIFTGEAGTGKSLVLKWLKAAHPNLFTVTATTGSAAVLLDSVTIDRVFCFNRENGVVNNMALQKTMKNTGPCIVIDEASMIGYKMAEAVRYVLDFYPQKRVVMVGDWAQAMPVKDNWPFSSNLFRHSILVQMEQIQRQEDPEFAQALSLLRTGEVDFDYFKRCQRPEPGNEEDCICAYATIKAAKERNLKMFEWSKGRKAEDEWTLGCRMEKRSGKDWKAHRPTSEREVKMFEDSRMADRMKVRRGTRVLITRNAADLSFSNGDTGTILDCDAGKRLIRVKLDRNGDEAVIPEIASLINDPQEHATFPTLRLVGFPLQYGWAVTIHRMQGMTLPRVWVDLASIYQLSEDMRHGLMYVACSRTRSPDHLGLDEVLNVARCDREVTGLL